MSKGILPQYIAREESSPKRITEKTVFHTDLTCLKEWLVYPLKQLKTEESVGCYYENVYFKHEIPQELAQKIVSIFQVPHPEDPECHVIEVTDNEINIYGLTERGLFYGGISLIHLLENGAVGKLLAYDYPVCKERGLKVFLPSTETMDYFKKFVDMICYFKYNSIMIEVGGAMEYKRHPEINQGWIAYCEEMREYSGKTAKIQDYTYPWYKNAIHMENGDGKFLTQDEVRHLVQYCRDRMMKVVPEVPSLGHCDYLMLGQPEIAERPEDPYADTKAAPKSLPVI